MDEKLRCKYCDKILNGKQKKFCCDKHRVYHYRHNNSMNNTQNKEKIIISDKKHYVYLATRKDAPNVYKIGYTQNIEEREQGLSNYFKTDFKIITFIECENKSSAEHLEKNIHKLFNEFHTNREFFHVELFSPVGIFKRIGDFIKPFDPWDNNFKQPGFFKNLKSELSKENSLPF